MSISTLTYANITTNSQTIYDSDPINYELNFNAASKLMFAVGVVVGQSVPYPDIDIQFYNYTVFSSNVSEHYYNNSIQLQHCNISNWQGVSDEVTQILYQLNLQWFLCPKIGFIQLQGKELYDIFKYGSIRINQCDYQNFESCKMGGMLIGGVDRPPIVNIVYINSIVNPNNNNAISYYIEDINQFELDANSSFTANIDFSQFKVNTDNSLMPWSSDQIQSGINTIGMGHVQSGAFSNNVYGTLNLRKPSQRLSLTRSYRKLRDVLSFVGGLLGPLLLGFSFLRRYNQYAYEIEFGERIFKLSHNTSVGSEDFNFFTFVQYLIYSMFSHLGIGKTWKHIQRYYQCKLQSVKQLDIHLLYRKIQLFEEVCNTVLESHHMIGLHLLSKKTLKQSKKMRKKHMMQEVIYGELERLGQVVSVGEENYAKQRQKFLKSFAQQPQKIDDDDDDPKIIQQLEIHREFVENYKQLELQCDKGDRYSYKIMRKLQQRKETPEDLRLGDEWPVVFDASQTPVVAQDTYPQTSNAINAHQL